MYCGSPPRRSRTARTHQQAACTADEIDDGAGYVLHAESDEDAADDKRHLALIETGRFTGVFQGMLRLTDADGNGDGENWGRAKGNASYTEADLAQILQCRVQRPTRS